MPELMHAGSKFSLDSVTYQEPAEGMELAQTALEDHTVPPAASASTV